MKWALIIAILLSLTTPVLAVLPDEILDDPVLEMRARDISKSLRCLVCQNQSIDESDASLARDLRLLVRERLVIGESDRQVIDYIVGRYGEFVLLKPFFGWHTIALWFSTPLVLLLVVSALFFSLKRRAAAYAAGTATSLAMTRKEKEALSSLQQSSHESDEDHSR